MHVGCRDDSLFVVLKNRYECKKKKFIKNACFFLAGLQLAISNPKYYMKSKKSDKGNYYTQMIVKSETTDFIG